MSLIRRVAIIGLIFTSILSLGAIGFHVIEGWTWTDSIYMSIITVTTVGFAEVQPLSRDGRVFTSILIILGVGGITYAFSAVTNYIIAGELQGFLEERRMRRQVSRMSQHYIVCGFGRMGRQICLTLTQENCALVSIDQDESAYERARDTGYTAILGDAGQDETLRQAGIKDCAGLVVATGNDAANVLIVLSARSLNTEFPIVARANSEEMTDKLVRAGADRVLFPYNVAGRRLAQMLLRPEVCEFLDVVTYDESLELLLENFTVEEGSNLDGKSMEESRIREKTGSHIVGLKRRGEGVIPKLNPTTRLQPQDIVFALGTREQLDQLSDMLVSQAASAARNS